MPLKIFNTKIKIGATVRVPSIVLVYYTKRLHYSTRPMKPSSTYKYLIFIMFVTTLTAVYAQQNGPSCGTGDSLTTVYLEKISKQLDLTARTNAGEMLEYRLAIDVDYKTANLYGQNQAKIRNAVYNVFAETSAIFEREMNIKLTVTFIHIWQVPEPYTLDNDFDYFNKILDYWARNRHEERDAVVSLSARYGTFLGGYRMCTSNFPGPDERFTVDILAHELGHTLGSPHTHNCSWPGGPIDRCSAVENTSETCPVSRQEFINGSIMSYCRSKLTFHPLCRNLIRKYAEGEIERSFSLKPYTEKPVKPGLITVLGDQGNATGHTPSFEWYASFRTKTYRVQISTDEAFNQILEDTTTNQSFFQSTGTSEGSYFFRYQPENDLGNSGWSQPVGFRVVPWSDLVVPAPLQKVRRQNSGWIYGSFKAVEGVSSYQLRIDNLYTDQFHETTRQVNGAGLQTFAANPGFGNDNPNMIRYRIRKQGIWSQWSAPLWLETPASTRHLSIDSSLPASAEPILAIGQWVAFNAADPLSGQAQIATDSLFRNIVYEHSFTNNSAGDWHTNKELLLPSLNEHATYFMRSRMVLPDPILSAWTVSDFSTGVRDRRFSYLGTPSKVLQSTTFSLTFALYNCFVKAGDNLYVFNYQGGYHHTTDLQSWKSFFPSTTNGQSPQILTAFGASPDGKTLSADPFQGFVLKTGDTFQSLTVPSPINWNDTETMVYSERYGFFMRSYDKLIIQYQDSIIFHRDKLPLGVVYCIAKDNQERIWVVGDRGAVWRFENDQWTYLLPFPYPAETSKIIFDKNDNCYIYGDFGVSKLHADTGQWELIGGLQKFNVKKVVFDKHGSLWLASYRFNDQHTGVENFALVKYTDGKTNVYADGLNFLREPFDLEYFKDQLLIMTTGGEIHAFDERQILAFTPQENYCAGERLDLGFATNSYFAAENRTSLELIETVTGKTITWEVAHTGPHQLTASLPDSLPPGRYSIAVYTTAPEISSHRSAEFTVLPSSACDKPTDLVLLQNRPNPIGPSGTIAFFLPQPETVSLELFNLLGQKVGDLAHGNLPQGWHSVDVNGVSLVSGIYVYRLKAGKITKSLKMIRN